MATPEQYRSEDGGAIRTYTLGGSMISNKYASLPRPPPPPSRESPEGSSISPANGMTSNADATGGNRILSPPPRRPPPPSRRAQTYLSEDGGSPISNASAHSHAERASEGGHAPHLPAHSPAASPPSQLSYPKPLATSLKLNLPPPPPIGGLKSPRSPPSPLGSSLAVALHDPKASSLASPPPPVSPSSPASQPASTWSKARIASSDREAAADLTSQRSRGATILSPTRNRSPPPLAAASRSFSTRPPSATDAGFHSASSALASSMTLHGPSTAPHSAPHSPTGLPSPLGLAVPVSGSTLALGALTSPHLPPPVLPLSPRSGGTTPTGGSQRSLPPLVPASSYAPTFITGLPPPGTKPPDRPTSTTLEKLSSSPVLSSRSSLPGMPPPPVGLIAPSIPLETPPLPPTFAMPSVVGNVSDDVSALLDSALSLEADFVPNTLPSPTKKSSSVLFHSCPQLPPVEQLGAVPLPPVEQLGAVPLPPTDHFGTTRKSSTGIEPTPPTLSKPPSRPAPAFRKLPIPVEAAGEPINYQMASLPPPPFPSPPPSPTSTPTTLSRSLASATSPRAAIGSDRTSGKGAE